MAAAGIAVVGQVAGSVDVNSMLLDAGVLIQPRDDPGDLGRPVVVLDEGDFAIDGTVPDRANSKNIRLLSPDLDQKPNRDRKDVLHDFCYQFCLYLFKMFVCLTFLFIFDALDRTANESLSGIATRITARAKVVLSSMNHH